MVGEEDWDESGTFITAFAPSSLRGDGTTNNTLTITYGANTTGLLRQAEIEFEATDGSTPLSTTRIRLTQLGCTADAFICDGTRGYFFTWGISRFFHDSGDTGRERDGGRLGGFGFLGDDTSVPTPDGSVVVAGFVTIDKTVSGSPTPSNTITVRYEANGGCFISRWGDKD